MFLFNLPRLGQAFLLTTIVAIVQSQHHGMSSHGPMDMVPESHGYGQCCTEKRVGSVSYTLLDGPFRGQIPHQCLNDCVYTVSGTSSPKFCFERGDLPTECLSDIPVIELAGGSGPHEGNLMIHGQPVCDDGWSQENALVVCRQLGYVYGEPTHESAFGPVSDDFALDDVECSGNEEFIWRCPHVTEDNCAGHEGAGVICSNESPPEQGSGSASPDPVHVEVWVKSASTNELVSNASVAFTLGDLVLSGTTDSNGMAVFTLSPDVTLDRMATIVISREGYISATIERMIRYGSENEIFQVFASPSLAEGEHRLVVSWDTTNDLDVYALQMDKTTGEIVCKTWYGSRGACAGVNLDVDVYSYGPETVTWTNADNDNYIYQLYVHDYDGVGVAGTGARITLYGETNVEMSVADSGSGELWWMLGTFEPSVGTSSFSTMDTLQNFDPDTSSTPFFRNKHNPNKPTKKKH